MEIKPLSAEDWVHEFHIADGYRGQGWGKFLMTKLIAQAQAAKLRPIVCETQNKNIPAWTK